MPHDTWLVEEEIEFDPTQRLDVRSVYIRLLEQMIGALKEPMFPPGTVKEELQSPAFHLPTVIFAYLDESGPLHTRKAQLICYRDMQQFLRELRAYGGDEILREYDLENLLVKAKEGNEK